MTQDSLNSVHEAILEALKIVSDAKRSAENAHARAGTAYFALRAAVPDLGEARRHITGTESFALSADFALSRIVRDLEALAASVARLQTDAKKPPISDANSEWGPWIRWEGGERPVPAETLVSVRFRNDEIRSERRARGWNWRQFDDPYVIVAYRVRQPLADPPPSSSEAKRVELAEALNRAEAAERDLEDVRKERDTYISAYTYIARTAERDHNRVAELSAEIKALRSERDSTSVALRDGLDPFAVVLATEGPAAYADRWRALATSLWADRLKGHADGRKDPDVL